MCMLCVCGCVHVCVYLYLTEKRSNDNNWQFLISNVEYFKDECLLRNVNIREQPVQFMSMTVIIPEKLCYLLKLGDISIWNETLGWLGKPGAGQQRVLLSKYILPFHSASLSAAPTLPTTALHPPGYQRQTEPEADCLATTQMAFSMDINSPTTGLDHT